MTSLEIELAEVIRTVKFDMNTKGSLEESTCKMVDIHLRRFDLLNQKENDEFYSNSKASKGSSDETCKCCANCISLYCFCPNHHSLPRTDMGGGASTDDHSP